MYDGERLGRVGLLMRSNEAKGASGFAWARHGLGVNLVAEGPLDVLHSLSDGVAEAMAIST